MNAILNRWHAWAAASAARRERHCAIADLDFDLPRPRMTRADAATLLALLALSGGFVAWIVHLLATGA
jgi:hypothetical protein